MSDVNEWIKERRRIHDAAPRGAWETSSAERDAFYGLPALLTAVESVLELLDDPGSPDSWSHTFQGRHSVFADDVRAAIEGAIK